MGQTFKLVSILFLLVLSVAVSCSPSEVENNQSSPDQNDLGKLTFEKQCALCHGVTGNKQLSGAKKLTESLISKDEIKVLVSNGMRQMPAFKERLTEKEIDLVSTYAFQFRDHK